MYSVIYIQLNTSAYTYWNQIRPENRLNNTGWRIDYFLYGSHNNNSDNINKITIENLNIMSDILGSDHCPICLEINFSD